MPWIRRVGTAGLSFLTRLASGYWNVFDPTNGYTAIHAGAFKFLEESNIDRRFFFETSMLIERGLSRAVGKDVYIAAVCSGQVSSLSEFEALIEFPGKLVRGFLRRIAVQYFVRDFGTVCMLILVGIPSIAFGTIYGSYHWIWSALRGLTTNSGTVMVSALPLILGVQSLLQALSLDIQNLPGLPLQLSADPPSLTNSQRIDCSARSAVGRAYPPNNGPRCSLRSPPPSDSLIRLGPSFPAGTYIQLSSSFL